MEVRGFLSTKPEREGSLFFEHVFFQKVLMSAILSPRERSRAGGDVQTPALALSQGTNIIKHIMVCCKRELTGKKVEIHSIPSYTPAIATFIAYC